MHLKTFSGCVVFLHVMSVEFVLMASLTLTTNQTLTTGMCPNKKRNIKVYKELQLQSKINIICTLKNTRNNYLQRARTFHNIYKRMHVSRRTDFEMNIQLNLPVLNKIK